MAQEYKELKDLHVPDLKGPDGKKLSTEEIRELIRPGGEAMVNKLNSLEPGDEMF